MNIEVIREAARQRPFRAFMLYLDNGKMHTVRHPEIIVTNILIMTIDDEGKPVLIAPEAVTSLEYWEAENFILEQTTDEP